MLEPTNSKKYLKRDDDAWERAVLADREFHARRAHEEQMTEQDMQRQKRDRAQSNGRPVE